MPTPATARRRAPAQTPAASAPASAQQQPAAAGGTPAYLQRKLRMGQAGDAYEMEADRVADQVVCGQRGAANGQAAPGVQRAGDEKKQDAGAAKPGQKGDGKAAPGKEQAKDQKGQTDTKTAAPGAAGKDQKSAAPAPKPAQPGEKKDQVARKEVSAEDKVDKAKEQHVKKQEAQQQHEAKEKGAHAETTDKDVGAHAAKPEEKPAAGPEQVQKKSAQPQISRMPDATLQREASGAGGGVGADTEQRIAASRGGGQPLPEQARTGMESGFGEDFSGVRVHHDAEADALARDLDARAFTVGNDVYFAQGAYDPDSSSGQHLLAHELTHVVQQGGTGGGVQRLAVQAAKPKSGGGGGKNADAKDAKDAEDGPKLDGDTYIGPEGTIDKDLKEVHIKSVNLAAVKAPPLTPGDTDLKLSEDKRGQTTQLSTWESAVAASKLGDKLQSKLAERPGRKGTKKDGAGDPAQVHYLKIGSSAQHLIGTRDSLLKQLARPFWSRSGAAAFYQVDHRHELQLGGQDELANLWLLQNWVNGQSGVQINGAVQAALITLRDAAKNLNLWKKAPTYDAVRYGANRVIDKAVFTAKPGKATAEQSYTLEDITGGAQLAPLVPVTAKDAGITGKADQLELFSGPTGGRSVSVTLKDGKGTVPDGLPWLRGLQPQGLTWDGTAGTMGVTLFASKNPKNNRILKPITGVSLTLQSLAGVPGAAYLDVSGVRGQLKGLSIKGWSPVEFGEVEMGDNGLTCRGTITVSVPLLKGAPIDIIISGDEVAVEKTFSAEEFQIPGPVKVDGASLTVKVGTHGLAATGLVKFSIERVGTGHIKATGSTEAGGTCELEGKFTVDPKIVDEGELTARYKDGKFSGEGKLGIKAGRIKGIKEAHAKVAIDGDKWDAKGEITPDVPGIERGDLHIAFDPEQGMTIGGDLFLKKLPGVSEGKLSAELRDAGDRRVLKASGDIVLAIPGLPATVHATYDDGIFTAELAVSYKKGMLDGQVTVGITNQPPSDDGAAASTAPAAPAASAGGGGGELTVYGRGTVTIQICPWLKGTVGITVTPDGHVKVRGEVALPSDIDLLPEKKYEKTLLSIGIDIPIVGVSFAGQRIGIFATIGGSLKFDAGIGPLKLRGLRLGIEYDPQNEDATHVTGGGEIVCPAHAGLRMEVHGGLGVGIPIVSATAGVEIGGELGLKGEAKAGVDVDWTRQKGLDLTAHGDITVQPTFKFDVSAYVKVEADLWVTTVNLYENHWNLASFEYGSGMEFGVSFPVHYTEAEGMNLALEQIEVKKPDIDPMSMLSGLMDKIT